MDRDNTIFYIFTTLAFMALIGVILFNHESFTEQVESEQVIKIHDATYKCKKTNELKY